MPMEFTGESCCSQVCAVSVREKAEMIVMVDRMGKRQRGGEATWLVTEIVNAKCFEILVLGKTWKSA